MNILIIGSEGFIGSHLRTQLESDQHRVICADVVALTRPGYLNISEHRGNFDSLFKDTLFDFCINASGSAHVGFSFEHPEIDFELNVLNVHKLLVAIRTYQLSCRFINFSSAAVYGNPARLPIAESDPTGPLSPYGFHKLQSELLIKEYYKFFGVKGCSLRVFSAYGPGLKKQLFWDLRNKSTGNNEVALFGSGNESRDFIYIDDLVQAVGCIMHNAKFEGEWYNIASGTETMVKDAVETFFGHLNPSIRIHFSGEEKTGDPLNWLADISLISKLGFEPKTSIVHGLLNTVTWMNTL